MRVEIVHELDLDDEKLEVPWASPTNPELRYADLKAHPAEIDRLDECRHNPAMAGLLRRANAPGSPFGTAKCGVWTTTELAEEERLDFNLPFKVGSYLDLLFDRPEFNSQLERQRDLAEQLEPRLGRLRVQAQMEVCLRRCFFRLEQRWGYYLTIFTHAYGATQAEAEEEWTRAIAALGNALAGIDQLYRRVQGGPPNNLPLE